MHPPPAPTPTSPDSVLGDEKEGWREGLEASPELDSVNHDGGRPPDRPILHNTDWKLPLSARPPRVEAPTKNLSGSDARAKPPVQKPPSNESQLVFNVISSLVSRWWPIA